MTQQEIDHIKYGSCQDGCADCPTTAVQGALENRTVLAFVGKGLGMGTSTPVLKRMLQEAPAVQEPLRQAEILRVLSALVEMDRVPRTVCSYLVDLALVLEG